MLLYHCQNINSVLDAVCSITCPFPKLRSHLIMSKSASPYGKLHVNVTMRNNPSQIYSRMNLIFPSDWSLLPCWHIKQFFCNKFLHIKNTFKTGFLFSLNEIEQTYELIVIKTNAQIVISFWRHCSQTVLQPFVQ